MLNRVVLIGRLTRDPELKYTPNGVAVTTFSLAVDRPFTDNQGKREADFINVVTWRGLAENVANYCKKGRLVAVEGRIQTRNYDGNDGKKVYVTEVVADNVRFLPDGRGNEGEQGSQGNSQQSGQQGNQGRQQGNQSSQQGSQRQGNQGQYQGNQGFNDDPFADDGQPIDISDDDLPF